MEDKTILQVNNLCKNYEAVEAVCGISFNVKKGEIVGLLGPNGAGKTTVINMILGVLEPTSGFIKVLGKNSEKERSEVSQFLNFAAVYSNLPGNLTVRQNLYVFGRLYSVKNLKEEVEKLLKEFNLEKFSNIKAGFLSSGEQSRLNLAKAMINKPRLILLDEPTASLDPATAQLMREKIKNYAKKTGAGVLWTSHNMSEVERMCDKVLFLYKGKIFLEGSPKDILEKQGQKDFEELFIALSNDNI